MPDDATPVELLRGLAVMAEPPEEGHGRIAASLGLPHAPSAAEYSDIFLFQLYPYASVHLGPEGMLGGVARDRVAGFWTALGYDAPAEPDHLAALLGLLASLAERATGLAGAERTLAEQATGALLHEHIAPWVFPFLTRVREMALPVYRAWAELLEGLLRAEIGARGRPSGRELPLHLRLAPPLPDPRVDGAGVFLEGLLAPVRSGMIVARADLARIASAKDLALRAGERRYALEHLLAQDAEAVLRGLADEAERQRDAHEARATWLGATAVFFAERCGATAALLRELAAERLDREEASPAAPAAAPPVSGA